MAIVTSSQQTDTHSAPAANGPRHTGRSIPVALLTFLGVLFFLNIVSRLCVGPLLPVIERDFGLRHSGAGRKDAERYRFLRKHRHMKNDYGSGKLTFYWDAPLDGGGNLQNTLENEYKAMDAAHRRRPRSEREP